MEAMYDVYEFDPLIIINMFHLQSSDTLKNLTPQLLDEIKDLIGKSMGSIVQIFQGRGGQGLVHRPPPGRAGRHVLVAVFRGHSVDDQQEDDRRRQGSHQGNPRARLRPFLPGDPGQVRRPAMPNEAAAAGVAPDYCFRQKAVRSHPLRNDGQRTGRPFLKASTPFPAPPHRRRSR
ncbi:MAG: hypothetical protein MZV70_60540 [Desulfobacterales bacterium]|nr:hypothetical protein [Desulfobacterales bacterium]